MEICDIVIEDRNGGSYNKLGNSIFACFYTCVS